MCRLSILRTQERVGVFFLGQCLHVGIGDTAVVARGPLVIEKLMPLLAYLCLYQLTIRFAHTFPDGSTMDRIRT